MDKAVPLARSELILGGQKSGKSRRAELLAREWLARSPDHKAVMIATAQACDDVMRQRIARHQQDREERVPGMQTVEEPVALGEALARHSTAQTIVVIDCLTLWLTTLLMQLAVIVVVLGIWQMAATFGWGVKVVVQSPSTVFKALVVLATGDTLWPNYWATLKATIVGLLIAVVIGTPLGLLLGLLPTAQRVVAPFLSALNAMPRIALAPVFIIVFGITMYAKVALAVSLVLFIMILNAIAGVSAADSEAVRMMATLGASKAQTLRMVVLPAAMPSILTGVRLGLIYSLLGVIASELIASADGLGQLIAKSAGVFDLATVYAVLFLLMVTAALFNSVSEYIGRRLLQWQPPTAH